MSSVLDDDAVLTTFTEGLQALDATRRGQGLAPNFSPMFDQDTQGLVTTKDGQQFKFKPSRLPGYQAKDAS